MQWVDMMGGRISALLKGETGGMLCKLAKLHNCGKGSSHTIIGKGSSPKEHIRTKGTSYMHG